jgi:hypothetical protein
MKQKNWSYNTDFDFASVKIHLCPTYTGEDFETASSQPNHGVFPAAPIKQLSQLRA